MSWSFPVAPSPEQEADYPALGFVPAPGDEPTAARIAQDVRQTATVLGDIVFLLSGTSGPGQWRGRSAEAFRENFDDDFRPKVAAARESFAVAASALEDWAAHMPEAQHRARNLEIEAREAQAALAALPTPTPVNPWEDMPDEDRERALDTFRRQRTDQEAAEQRLESVRARARELLAEYTEFGESVADRLDRAMNIAPNKPGWLSRIGDAIGAIIEEVGDIAQSVMENVGRWIREHAARLARLGDFYFLVANVIGTLQNITRWGARFVPVPHIRLGLQLVSQGLKTSETMLKLAGLGAYGLADWGGADVTYPWEELEMPWENTPWEDDVDTRPVEMDQFLPQGSYIEPAAAGAEAGPFLPSAANSRAVGGALPDTAETADANQLGPAVLPSPRPVAIPEVPLLRSFDSAWQGVAVAA
ncbi:hypothetical protein FH609_019855 [Streptomyces sp. 3MP-14]|uniref:WXG100 family type VII secretion target n=1 Tax=Streptomyces mimosae TaxID=2586635 RepID=A0A5N5ZQX0_9ACTN|nr:MULTISPECIES: hypothetical protein [Streptomyces]KAB8158907.1 hypothetical protein FH607_028845 [Streptomyces mimosae]KAB8174853.1 hypothetical protein FH609_019855 [Streptomyces sp. 3MP-14]